MNKSVPKSAGGIYLMPFILLFLLSGFGILHTTASQEGSAVNQVIDSISYSSALYILIKKQPAFFAYTLSNSLPLIILLFFGFLSIMWTDFYGQVLLNTVHKIGACLIAICASVIFIKDMHKFFNILLYLFFFYFIATIFLMLVRPDVALMPVAEFGAYRAGLRGFTLHPNTLGAICVVGVWVAMGSLSLPRNRKKHVLMAGLLLISIFFCLIKADSMTSMLVSIALVAIVMWFSLIQSSSGGVKALKICLMLFGLLASGIFLYILKPEAFSVEYFFKAIGRNSTLTGRLSLWELGLKGFYAKPFFGWGEDRLFTFFNYYHEPVGQFHNGYVDLLVRGGVFSAIVFIILLFQVLAGLINMTINKNRGYITVLAFVTIWLVHNITEASIFKSPNILWLQFLILYFFSVKHGQKLNTIR